MLNLAVTESESSVPPLFERFVRLREGVARVSLGHWPTPIDEAAAFARAYGLASLHIKREDLACAECGGNKVRGLELLLADARARDAKSIITFGSAGSHHISRTAYHAAKFDMLVTAVYLDQPPTAYAPCNISHAIRNGATYIRANALTALPKFLLAKMRLSSGDRRPCYYMPPGGTSPLACIGHVNAAFELRRQVDAGLLPAPDYIYVALGSLGTAAGLALGCRIAGLSTRVVGVVVSYQWYCTRGRWTRLANRTLRLMCRLDPAVPWIPLRMHDVDIVRTARGERYALATEAGTSVANAMLRLERLTLDAAYTSKVLDGMLQFIERGGLHDRRHLFWNTYAPLREAKIEREKIPEPLRKYFA